MHHSVPICAFKTRVTIQNCSILVKIVHFLACGTLKFHRWLPKPLGHLSYATLKLCAAFRISITSMGWSVARIAWLNTWSAIILTHQRYWNLKITSRWQHSFVLRKARILPFKLLTVVPLLFHWTARCGAVVYNMLALETVKPLI